MVRDPVCGEDLEDVEYPEIEEHKGQMYFFGALECAQEFRRNPDKYVAGREEELGVPVPDYARRSRA